jgi:4'-phosphopantetheinyl transferase
MNKSNPKANYEVKDLSFTGENQSFTASLAFVNAPFEELNPTHLLHPDELDLYTSFAHEKKKHDFLLGKFVGKLAINNLLKQELNFNKIHIDAGIFRQPIVRDQKNINISLSHSIPFSAAIAFDESQIMGIDIEKIDPSKHKVIESQMTEAELSLLGNAAQEIFWTAKEAMSKVLKTGLMLDMKLLEIEKIELINKSTTCYFKNFRQYKACCFVRGDVVMAIVMPRNNVFGNELLII